MSSVQEPYAAEPSNQRTAAQPVSKRLIAADLVPLHGQKDEGAQWRAGALLPTMEWLIAREERSGKKIDVEGIRTLARLPGLT